jgi:hypothetical protein
MVNLAETIQFSGPQVALILLMLLTVILAVGGTVAAGCLFAYRAGKGSDRALFVWGVIAFVEVGFMVFAIVSLGVALSLIMGGALAVQVALYVAGRSGSAP